MSSSNNNDTPLVRKGEVVLELFAESRIQLQREVNRHPMLVEILLRQPQADYETEQLPMIAAYCSIMLEGAYSYADITELEDMLFQRLVSKRSTVVSASEGELNGRLQ